MTGKLEAQSMQRYLVPGLQRGLEILRCFSRDRTEITAAEIAKELGIPRSTVFRLMTTLEYLGFLERSRDGRDYRLGVAVLTLGFEYLASLEITERARPILEKLRGETGFNSHLVIRDGRDIVFVLKVSAPSSFVGSVMVGTRLPAHATVLGRVFLAYMDDAQLRALYPKGKLESYSPQTPTSLDELKKILVGDRARGYAISENFFERGISAIAAPVFDTEGTVAAAIHVTVPEGGATSEELHGAIAAKVVAAAKNLSHQLDYRQSADQGQRAGARAAR
jgi:DNA-binding IclR family transcriptional regulator